MNGTGTPMLFPVPSAKAMAPAQDLGAAIGEVIVVVVVVVPVGAAPVGVWMIKLT